MTKTFDLAVIGELNVDLLLYDEDVVPAFGQVEKLVDDVALTVGGSSAIFAHQAALLGLQVGFVGKVGKDDFGEFLVRRLGEAGVETSNIIMDPGVRTGITVHLVRGTDRAMLTYPGSIASLYPEEVEEGVLDGARHVHVGSYFLQEGIQRGLPAIFARARRAGATTSLDPGWDPKKGWDSNLRKALDHTDVFLPNEQELLELAGRPTLKEALESFASLPTVVVKRGADGAMARSGGVAVSCKPPPVTAVDSTGAGDSFDAGFLFGMLEGDDLDRCLETGCLCGALSTERAGGVDAQPNLERIQSLSGKGEEA